MNKTKDALFVVGNGSPGGSYESDALVLDDGGNLWVAGSIKCGGDSGGYTLSPATADTLGGVMIGDNISVTADGVISVNLSAYLKSDEISDWAKAENKPAYTASEVGLGNVDNTADIDKPISIATQTALDGKSDTGHTHTVSDITDMPAYLTQETDPTVPAWAKAKISLHTQPMKSGRRKRSIHITCRISQICQHGRKPRISLYIRQARLERQQRQILLRR